MGVIAPAGAVPREDLEAGIALLEAKGLRVRLGASVWKRHGYLAGTDEERARDLVEMFVDPNVRAVFAARGGYGCTRLLPHLDAALLRNHAKIFVGSSDCSALLTFLVDRCGMVAFHGPVVTGLARRSDALDRLLEVLSGKASSHVQAPRCLRPGRGEGTLRGGCLSVLGALVGTPWAPAVHEPTIWFFEDVNEKPYRIDRLLTQWMQAGLWAATRGIVWGEMVDCDAPGNGWDIWTVIQERTAFLGVPMAAELPSGHGAGTITLPLGIHVRLADAQLEYLEPWVIPGVAP